MQTTMEGGTLNDDTETMTLRADLASVLIEAHKDGLTPLGNDVPRQVLREFAEVLAEKLRPRIGGRYIPKTADRDERAARNVAVWEAFNGRNHAEVMRQFNISRRLLQSILASQRRRVSGRG